MRIFARSRCKSTTPFVLALWLFALAAGVAHACGLDEVLAQAGGREAASARHLTPGDAALPACEQFCADDIPLVKTLKTVQDSPAGTALLVPVFPPSTTHVENARTFGARSGSGPPPDLAINTRFVRLAL